MNLNQARGLLDLYCDADIPTFLWGPPGVGKSQLVHQRGDDEAVKVIDFRCSTRDPVALMGIPSVDGDTARWKVPDEFPQVERDGARGYLFLDELNAAAPSMQAAAFGLVLDRKVGEYSLPPGWRVIAAGNRQSDKAAAQRMPSALANRFAHIDVDADVETTVRHFADKGHDPILLAFLRFRSELLHKMDGAGDLRAFPTPRAWEQVAKVIDAPDSVRGPAIAGLVGDGAAAEMEGFIRVYRELPSLDMILANPNSARVPSEPAAKYAVAVGLARKVNSQSFDNGMTYIKRIEGREFDIMFTVDAVRSNLMLIQ